MLENPDKEWRRLAEHYASMYDEQLLDLAADFSDLTEMAQRVLRDEMLKRKLDDPSHQDQPPAVAARFGFPEPATLASRPDEGSEEGEAPHEYTWKTELCSCEEWSQAWQVRETLRRAGIESWIDTSAQYVQFAGRGPRVQVAADQLQQAREIISRPIPQEVIDEMNAEVPEFEPPKCPQCGAFEPILLTVEPVNTWGCDICGKEWFEPPEVEDEKR